MELWNTMEYLLNDPCRDVFLWSRALPFAYSGRGFILYVPTK